MAPLRVGVELIAANDIPLRLGSFFESWLAVPGGSLRRSLGRDDYHLDVVIAAGRRVAATGRTHICQLNAEEVGIGVNQARGAGLVPCSPDAAPPLFLGLRTNVFLDLPSLLHGVHLRLVRDGTEPEQWPLADPRLGPSQIMPGRFLVDLTGVLGDP